MVRDIEVGIKEFKKEGLETLLIDYFLYSY